MTEEDFEKSWHEIELLNSVKRNILDYIRKTWLPFKEYFVGNCVTSRAEGAHSKLKKYLGVSTGDIRSVKQKMCLLIRNEVEEIKAPLESERLRILHKCNNPFFKEVATRVSIFALKELEKKFEMVSSSSLQSVCTGKFTATMGLPCAHMMQRWNGDVIPLEAIHSQRRIDTRVSLFSNNSNNEECLLEGAFTKLHEKFQQWPLVEQNSAIEKLSQLVDEVQPLSFEPNIQRGKGRPSRGRKRKATSSTKRDSSHFEIVEASLQQKKKDPPELERDVRTKSVENSMDLVDLNYIPYLSDDLLWN